jgi:hypothetical protein
VNSPIRAFFSYASGDGELAGRLRAALGDLGVDARTDADIPVGYDWGEHLRAAMDTADALVFLVTPAALANAYVMSEVGAAIAAGKPVVPVVTTAKGLPAGLPAPLRNWQFVRAGKRGADKVAAEIRERLQQLPATAA